MHQTLFSVSMQKRLMVPMPKIQLPDMSKLGLQRFVENGNFFWLNFESKSKSISRQIEKSLL